MLEGSCPQGQFTGVIERLLNMENRQTLEQGLELRSSTPHG